MFPFMRVLWQTDVVPLIWTVEQFSAFLIILDLNQPDRGLRSMCSSICPSGYKHIRINETWLNDRFEMATYYSGLCTCPFWIRFILVFPQD